MIGRAEAGTVQDAPTIRRLSTDADSPAALDTLGHEARAEPGDHAALKLWLRLLASSTQIEDDIRRRLRARFGISLPRFDYLAQLYRRPEGLAMKELSQCLMVTGGSVTGLTDELEREGLVARRTSPSDRRSAIVCLTATGHATFSDMAREHEGWIADLFGGLSEAEVRELYALLGRVREQLPRAV